jgi:hypothetical protein
VRDSLARIRAVIRTDLLIRVRRPSSIALFLVLCAFAYLIVPASSAGWTLIMVDGHRALYNSATIALVTGGLATILLGLLGFYLVSNTVRRDIVSRNGAVIAATPVGNVEYLAGKFLGNAAFLGLVTLGYMLNVMVMHLIRGEAPLEPWVYLSTYLAMAGPAILVVSALALLFECIRPLSGRVGDVLYFIVWVAMISVIAAGEGQNGVRWPQFTDVLGMRFMVDQVQLSAHAQSLSIVNGNHDVNQVPWAFPGIQWSWMVLASRVVSALPAIPVLLLALAFFVRFDPAWIKGGVAHTRSGILIRVNRLLKPATRVLLPLVGRGSGLWRAGLGEFALTLMLSPLALVAWFGLSLWALLATPASLHQAVLPLMFLGITASISDVATRDGRAGTTALLYSLPRVRSNFVLIKLAGASLTALAFLLVPLVRVGATAPPAALSLLIGGLFVTAAAVSLGRLTGSGKAFTGLFLLFFYMVLNLKQDPRFDFAGWNGVATGGTRVGYLLAAGVLVAVALVRRWGD